MKRFLSLLIALVFLMTAGAAALAEDKFETRVSAPAAMGYFDDDDWDPIDNPDDDGDDDDDVLDDKDFEEVEEDEDAWDDSDFDWGFDDEDEDYDWDPDDKEVYEENSVTETPNSWKTENGKLYYYGKNGKRVKGWKVIGKDVYYFDDGAVTGLRAIEGSDGTHTYYFAEDGKMLANGWATVDGIRRYFGDNGKQVLGWKNLDGDVYYLRSDGVCTDNWYLLIKDETPSYFLFDADGKLITTIRKMALEDLTLIRTSKDLKPTGTPVLKIAPANAVASSLIWSSSNINVATVDEDGLVTGLEEGTTVITCLSNDRNHAIAACTVTVENKKAETVKLDISDDEPLEIGDAVQLEAEILPADAIASLSWSSSDEDVATVSEDGLVTAIGKGEAVISAKTENGVKAEATINVIAPAAQEVRLDREKVVKLPLGTTLKLNATVLPESAETTLTWSSTKPKVAMVSENGTVTPVGVGKTSIRVTTENGLTAAVDVQVILKAIGANKVELKDKSPVVLELDDDPLTLKATMTPVNATSVLTWSSSDEKIAKVNNDGTVTPLKKGEVTIKVTTDNGKSASIKVKINAPKPTGVSLKPSGTVNVALGETLQLTAVMKPETAEDGLTWSSSKKSVATVNGDGLVTPVKAGKTTVTVKTDNNMKAKVTINVVLPEAKSVELDRHEAVRMRIGDTVQLSAEILPAKADKTLTWKSSDSEIATVSSGLITAVSAGVATISASTQNGKTDSLMIIVLGDEIQKVEPTGIKIKETDVELEAGKKLQLTAKVSPSNAETVLTWKTDKKKIVKVDNDGRLTGVAKGTATVTVTTDNGLEASVTVKVLPPEPEEVELNETGTVELDLGETLQLEAILQPAGTESELTWSSSNNKVAGVSGKGLVTAKKLGFTTITVETENEKTASVIVKVVQPALKGINLQYKGKTKKIFSILLKQGKEATFTVIPIPQGATIYTKKLTATSTKSSIASVSVNRKKGTVTVKAGKKIGAATITVTTIEGFTATIKVKVKKK